MLSWKKLAIAATLVMVLNPSVYAADKGSSICTAMFREFNISPEIKSAKGWQRVKFKDSIDTYVDNKEKLTAENKNELIDCLISSSVDLNSLAHTVGDR
jgi:hypothetical protein